MNQIHQQLIAYILIALLMLLVGFLLGYGGSKSQLVKECEIWKTFEYEGTVWGCYDVGK